MTGGADLLTEVAEAVAAHQYGTTALRGVSQCSCGAPMHGMPHWHREHLAEVLTEHFEERLADRDAARLIAALAPIRAAVDGSCHHCGKPEDANGDHTCLCPTPTIECVTHRQHPVTGLSEVLDALDKAEEQP